MWVDGQIKLAARQYCSGYRTLLQSIGCNHSKLANLVNLFAFVYDLLLFYVLDKSM